MEPDDGRDDGHESESSDYRRPPSPDDRLWRHPSEVASPGAPRPAKPRSPWLIGALSAVVGGVLTTGLVTASGAFGDHTSRRATLVAASGATMAPTVLAAARRARNSTVALEVKTAGGTRHGVGVVFRDGGYVMTNAHLVEGARSVRARVGHTAARPATVVGLDREFDVAVVKVSGATPPSARIGTAGGLRPGQMLVAVSPEPDAGRGGSWATLCTVTGVHRPVQLAQSRMLLEMIETDSPGAPRSTGAALIDNTGAVVGIGNAAASRAIGGKTGLATPIDVARLTADQLVGGGTVHKTWLGIEGSDIDAQLARELDIRSGAVIGKVLPESPAAAAGLRERDVVVAVDGQPIETMAMLVVVLHLHRPGDTVTVEVVRGKERQAVKVTLAERR